MLSPRGVKGDEHLLKRSYEALVSRPQGVTWKDPHLGDDKINARRIKGGRFVVPPPLLPFCNTASQTPLMLRLKQPQRRDLGRSGEEWCDEGMKEKAAVPVREGRVSECESGPLEVSFCLRPSWSPVFLWSHAASCVIPQPWVTGPGVKARQRGQILRRGRLTLCLFSAFFLWFLLNPLRYMFFSWLEQLVFVTTFLTNLAIPIKRKNLSLNWDRAYDLIRPPVITWPTSYTYVT